MRVLVALAIALSLAAPGIAPAANNDCEAARCAVQAQLSQCPCETASNHGRYVSCVAHVVRDLARDGTIPTNCKGKVTRCAARSTCGKEGFVTCQIPTDTCDTATSTCTNNPAITCLTDLDCGSRCKISASGDLCTARGGTVGGSTSCCPSCAD